MHGVIADKDMKKYIASVFSDPDPAELQNILHDKADSDSDSLIDLIFTPDETVQCQLETLIETEPFNFRDEECICQRIEMQVPESYLIMPDDGVKITLSLTPGIITAFVSRLKLTQRLPLKLRTVINQQSDQETALRIKVKLRNSGMKFTSASIDFLCAFFKALSQSKRFPDYLDFVIPFVESLPANTTIRMALQNQRNQCQNHIDLANRFEILLKQSNMETLMLQGIRTPYISKAETLAKIAVIDDIYYAIMARTEYNTHN